MTGIFNYLQMIFNTISRNDISARQSIYSEESYLQGVNFLIDSIRSNVSSANIDNTLKANKKPIDNKTVSKYIDSLVKSNLFYRVKRYDIKGKIRNKIEAVFHEIAFQIKTDQSALNENVKNIKKTTRKI